MKLGLFEASPEGWIQALSMLTRIERRDGEPESEFSDHRRSAAGAGSCAEVPLLHFLEHEVERGQNFFVAEVHTATLRRHDAELSLVPVDDVIFQDLPALRRIAEGSRCRTTENRS